VNRRRLALALFLAAAALPAAAASPLFDVYKKYIAAIDASDVGAAKKLVSSGKRAELDAMYVNAVDDANTSALMRIADKCDTTDAVKALLKAGARTDLKSAGGATALQMAEWSECRENAAAIRGAGK